MQESAIIPLLRLARLRFRFLPCFLPFKIIHLNCSDKCRNVCLETLCFDDISGLYIFASQKEEMKPFKTYLETIYR